MSSKTKKGPWRVMWSPVGGEQVYAFGWAATEEEGDRMAARMNAAYPERLYWCERWTTARSLNEGHEDDRRQRRP